MDVATGTARARLAWLWWVMLAVLLVGGVTVLTAVPHPAGKHDAWGLVVVAYLLVVGFGGAVLVMARTERRPVAITSDGTYLRVGRFGAVRLYEAPGVGVWFQDRTGAPLGGVLHLRGERGPIRVGALGYEPAAAGPTDPAAAAHSVHVTVSGEDFDALLRLLGARREPPPVDAPTRVELFAAPAGASGGQIAVLFGVLVVGGVLIGVAATAVARLGLGVWVGDGGAALLFVALLVTGAVMFRRRGRPAPARAVTFHGGTATVFDGTGRPLAAAPPIWRPCHHQGYRGSAFPAIELTVAPLEPMTVVVFDMTPAWPEPTPRSTGTPLLVGLPDWIRLLDALHRT